MNRDGGIEADLEVIRDLIRKYGWSQFENMVQIAGRSLYEPSISSSSRASIISTAATSISRTTSSGLSYYTDTSSLRSHPGTIPPWQQQLPPLPIRSSDTSVASRTSTPGGSFSHELQTPLPVENSSAASDLDPEGGGDGSRTKLQCPFCTEYGIGQWIGRKPDLKRHFNKIHASNAQWTCKLGGGCNLTFDFHTAYDAHVKKDHGGVKDPDAKVNLCQQVVWACGFETCREVFEAKTDDHGPKVMNNYFEHVLGHVISSACGRWSYTRRVRNLLHQELVRHAWKDCDKGPLDELMWQPQSSSVLRKMLECRHINDPIMLCKYAVLLGSGHPAPAMPPSQFAAPILNTCKIASTCHDPRHDARFSKGGLLNFRRHSKPSTPRPSGRITGSQPKSRVTVLRSPPHLSTIPPSLGRPPLPVSNVPSSSMMNMFVASAPQLETLQPYSPHSEFSMGSADGTSVSLGYTEQSALPALEYHPLELYSGYQSLGEPPSLHQFLGAKDDHSGRADVVTNHYAQKVTGNPSADKQHRPRRNSSPGSDCRMGGESPVSGFSSTFQPNRHDQGGRRRSSTTMDFAFP